MKVLLSTIGSRGDVQPLVALALELRALGHEATLCAPPTFQDWVESFGLACFPVGPDVKKFMASAAASRPSKPFKLSPERARQLAASTVRDQFRALSEAARGCDLVVAATALQIAARSIAEKLDLPYVFVAYSPAVFPAPDHPPPVKRGRRYPQWLPGVVNRALWWMDERSVDGLFLATLNEERAKIGLLPVDGVSQHIFADRPWLAADPTLAPASFASRLSIVQTGAWFLPDEARLPDELERFLASGEPPVYLGFGSMQEKDPMGRLLVDAARAAGLRAILSRGWGHLDLALEGADCIRIDDVNHERLFARVAAVVHHGGAGTTTTAAKAGVPQVVVAHSYDQPYFSHRVQKLGVGVSAPPPDRLTVEALASALRHCARSDVQASARSLAALIAVDGAKMAAKHVTAATFGND